MTPVALLNWLSSDRLWFAVDGVHPTGAVHHQKIVVVDDVVAFCGGMDLTVDRWDTSEHLDPNTIRRSVRRRAAVPIGEPAGARINGQRPP